MKQFTLFAILATSLALFLSCGGGGDDPELKTQIYIQGTVKDASSGLPIADAEITLSFGGSTLHQGKTDGEGAFSFPISEAGDYKFLVSASGYEDTEKLFPLTDLSKNEVTITMMPEIPSVRLDNVVGIETAEATLNGTVLKSGSPAYTEKGFCYGVAANPSLGSSNCEKIDGTAQSFSLHISNLSAATTYYVRAYIDNGVQPVQYSNSVQFKTLLLNGPQLVDTRDGKTYRTVSFSSYTWMIDDLRYNSSTGTYAWFIVEEDICPSGWHLPNNGEWNALANALGGSVATYFNSDIDYWSADGSIMTDEWFIASCLDNHIYLNKRQDILTLNLHVRCVKI